MTLHLYPDQNIGTLKRFWSEVTQIPVSQFHVPHVHVGTKGSYKKKSQYGTVAIVYSDSELLKIINSWIAEYKQRFAALAQLVEQRICNAQVPSSSLGGGSAKLN